MTTDHPHNKGRWSKERQARKRAHWNRFAVHRANEWAEAENVCDLLTGHGFACTYSGGNVVRVKNLADAPAARDLLRRAKADGYDFDPPAED